MGACCKTTTDSSTIPGCVQDIIDEGGSQFETLKTVKSQSIDGTIHYWLNTDARHVDGPEYIVNMSCDTICSYCGFCVLPDCIDSYNEEEWQEIWSN